MYFTLLGETGTVNYTFKVEYPNLLKEILYIKKQN